MFRFLNVRGLLIVSLIAARSIEAASPNLQYLAELGDDQRQEWTDAHNHYRRLASSPEATNMRFMTWDNELEELAKKVVSTCDFTHTSVGKLATSTFPEVGENLYSGNLFTGEEILSQDGVTKAWYDENVFYNYENKTCQPNKMCGHYTQVVWAKTDRVGCAIAKCSSINSGTPPFLVSCNYGPAGNIYDYAVPRLPYLSGESCSQCDDGDSCDEQLCKSAVRDHPVTTTIATSSPSTSRKKTYAGIGTSDKTTTLHALTRPTSTKTTTIVEAATLPESAPNSDDVPVNQPEETDSSEELCIRGICIPYGSGSSSMHDFHTTLLQTLILFVVTKIILAKL